MVSGKVDKGGIKDIPYRERQGMSGLWPGKLTLFTAMIGRDEFTQFSSGKRPRFRQGSSLQLLYSVFYADRKQKTIIILLSHMKLFLMISELQIT